VNRSATKLPERQRQANRRLSAWLLPALLILDPAAALAQTYTTIDCPDSSFTEARSINDRGEIVGICEDVSGVHGFLLSHGAFTIIDVPGATATLAFGVNNRGDVVGRYTDTAGVFHGYLLRHGRFSTIDPPGSLLTSARGIDDLGRIVGFYLPSDGVFRGFLLDARGFRDIVVPDANTTPGTFEGGTGSFDIDNLERIVGGYVDTSEVFHGFLLNNGVFTSVDPPGATGARALGINILGRIVGGWSEDPDCPDCFTRAFLLTPRGFADLEVPGAFETVANGINAVGQIVGTYLGEDENVHGFLRDPEND
jgi:uncharacterized membrane protein